MNLLKYLKALFGKQPKSNFRLSSCPKHYTLDQDKVVKPAETVKMALGRLGKRFDLSHVRIEARKDAVEGAYSFSSLSDQMAASGKGLTPEQSRASAIMEFTERYSWLHFDYEKYHGYTVKSYNEIKKGDTPTVAESWFLCNYAEIKEEDKKKFIEEIKDIPLKWIKGVSLQNYRYFYYPLSWYNYVLTSNGLATGNAMEEAILQALCETIERENTYRLFGNRREGNDLDQSSITNPLLTKVLKNAKERGIRFIVKDISFDFRVPTFLVHGINEADKGKLAHRGCGYGTHPDPEKALMRAFSEYFEGYSSVKAVQDELKINWEKIMRLMPKGNFGFLVSYNTDMLEKCHKVVKLNDLPNLCRHDIKDEIKSILKILKKHRYNVIFLDKTHPELNIPVPRIFVPGFRNLTAADVRDPWMVMGAAYYEAGNLEAAQRCIRRSTIRDLFNMPETASFADPKRMFKKDYIETMIHLGGIKKDTLQFLKTHTEFFKKIKLL